MVHVVQEIDYKLLGTALDFYKSNSYTYFEAPWMVAQDYTWLTMPPNIDGAFNISDRNMHLVGSAEQAFIQEAFEGRISMNTKYVSCTPCFRKGDNGSKYHQETFMKIELSLFTDREEDETVEWSFLHDAKRLFDNLNSQNNIIDRSNDIIDILSMDISTGEYIEIGSYGRRVFKLNGKTLYFHYGTGLAIPRFQFTINK